MTSPRSDLEEPLLPPSSRGGLTEGELDVHEENARSPSSAPASPASTVSRSPSPSPSDSHISHKNVKLCLLYTFFAFAGRSVWSQSVLATFVYLFTKSSPRVGYSAAVLGAVQLLVSLPSGFFADHKGRGGRGGGRSRSLRLASLVGLIAVGLTLYACWYRTSHPSYELLLVALAAWGAYWGIANTALMALFADSVPNGMIRSHYFTLRSTATLAGNTIGPMVSLVMFVRLGDTWTLPECATVIAVGQLLFFPALFLAYWFEDVATPASSDEGGTSSPSVSTNGTVDDDNDDDTGEHEAFAQLERPLLVRIDEPNSDDPRQRREIVEHGVAAERMFDGMSVVETSYRDGGEVVTSRPCRSRRRQDNSCRCCCLRRQNRPKMVPYLIAAGDVMSGLGAGMSVQHLPIFLMDQLELKPVQVQAVAVVTPLVVAGLMQLAQRLASGSSSSSASTPVRSWSRWFGRCRVALAFKWTGVAFMALMIASYQWWHAPRFVTCLLYVVRSGFMNSTSALTRSVLMDHVPSHQRGRWSAVESINMFSWSGSAALGGLVIAQLGSILPLFGITALVQFVASLFLIPLLDIDDCGGSDIADDDDYDDDDDQQRGLGTERDADGEPQQRQRPGQRTLGQKPEPRPGPSTIRTSVSSSSFLSSSTTASSSSNDEGRPRGLATRAR